MEKTILLQYRIGMGFHLNDFLDYDPNDGQRWKRHKFEVHPLYPDPEAFNEIYNRENCSRFKMLDNVLYCNFPLMHVDDPVSDMWIPMYRFESAGIEIPYFKSVMFFYYRCFNSRNEKWQNSMIELVDEKCRQYERQTLEDRHILTNQENFFTSTICEIDKVRECFEHKFDAEEGWQWKLLEPSK